VLEEFIRETYLAQGGINLRSPKILTNSGSNTADTNTIFDCDN
jgi:hypothetical protein